MSERLIDFNDPRSLPTLKSFVDSFAGGWVDQIKMLSDISREARETTQRLDNAPWAVNRMIELFDEQIELLKAANQTIEGLKESRIYQWESNKAEDVIHTTNYEKTLECINITGKMFKRLPSTYTGKKEEHLSDHILVTLGTTLIGSAIGETFNK